MPVVSDSATVSRLPRSYERLQFVASTIQRRLV